MTFFIQKNVNKNRNVFANLSTDKLFLDILVILIRRTVTASKHDQASLCLQAFDVMLHHQCRDDS